MTEKEPEKENFRKELDDIKSAWSSKTKQDPQPVQNAKPAQEHKPAQEPKPIFSTAADARDNTAEALDKKLRSMAAKKPGTTDRLKAEAPQEIFKVQERLAEKKTSSKTFWYTALVALLLVGIGYPTKLAYEGKLEVIRLSKDYKLLQVTIDTINKRNYELYRKIFPQVDGLDSSRMDSALKGIEDNLDQAVRMNAEADGFWAKAQYDQALDLYDRASKTNPLNNRSAYLAKEAELTRMDQTGFRQFYTVKAGDTLESLAKRAKVSAVRIRNANGPRYPMLYQGRVIKGMQLTLPINIERAP